MARMMPDDKRKAIAHVLARLELMQHDELWRLQALLVARALKIDFTFIGDADVSALIQRFDPEVGRQWTPDEAFFRRLRKPDLIAALDEAAVADIPRSGNKGQLVGLAVARLPAMSWLPKPMRSPSYAGPGSNAWADAQGAQVADAIAGMTSAAQSGDAPAQQQAAE